MEILEKSYECHPKKLIIKLYIVKNSESWKEKHKRNVHMHQ